MLAGTLGVTELACNTVVFSIAAFFYMVTLGISEAACAIIGNCIGAGNVPLAKRFFTIITKVEIVAILVVASIIFFLRTQISASYTSEPEV